MGKLIGKMFDESLTKYGVTQAEIAEKSQTSRRQVNQFCVGVLTNPKLETFEAFVMAMPVECRRWFLDQLFVSFEVRQDDDRAAWIENVINLALTKTGYMENFKGASIYQLADLLMRVDVPAAMQICLEIQSYLLTLREEELSRSKFPASSNNWPDIGKLAPVVVLD